MTTYTSAEVKAHNTADSCWVIHNDGVFDMTSFVQDHPGGEEYILDNAGKDITQLMKDELSHTHSEGAYEMMDDFRVGTLDTSSSSSTSSGLQQRAHVKSVQSSGDDEDYLKPTDLAADKKTKFLDLSKPLLWQLWNSDFSKAFYLEQVHIPRHLSRPAQIFGAPYLEVFTKTPWYMIPIFWLPIIAYNVKRSLETGFAVDQVALYFLSGMALWTLAEYVIHRFLFHLDDLLPDSTAWLTLHFLLHGIHHYLPMDRLRLVMPPALAVALAFPLNALGHSIFADSQAYAVMAGAFFGYVLYDMTHFFLHHSNQPFAHFREMKTYHLAHHYKNFQGGYGITSKIWDKVFNTELVL
ncbi:4-hydroxysphinganine ceramide fatty acyl 2-hydroxylase [Entomortierella parvispora]|uniref:Ceramide very long chain fatty acid hydroxylase n=1 Tax=Entomortierella parvispora TaxID=205924 RepID=A0A9P3HJP1_9FUNG|nr:4-hydroxysphinganine ceramide fatty acyl 2-hydroxylase [Entomortierella parvispora]